MVSLILLLIGGGWTLPSDAVRLGLGSSGSGGGGGLKGTTMKNSKFVFNPAGSLLNLVTNCGGGGGVVDIMIIAVHAILAQWGRTFDDDFDTNHALEHPPGKVLMILRL
jgi:hypothetical protein